MRAAHRSARAHVSAPGHLGPPPARRHATRTSRRSFTLLELVVALVILIILAALAIPTFQSTIDSSKDATAKSSLVELGRLAWAEQVSANAAPTAGTGYTSTSITTAVSTGGLGASGSPAGGLSADGVGSSGLSASGNAWTTQATPSNAYGQVEPGLRLTGSDTASPNLQLAMMTAAGHCITVTFNSGNLVPNPSGTPVVGLDPQYTPPGGSVVNPGHPLCAVTSAYTPTGCSSSCGGGGGGGGGGGSTPIVLDGTAGTNQVNLSWATITGATAYDVSCPQIGIGSTVGDYGHLSVATPTGVIGAGSGTGDGNGAGSYTPPGGTSAGTTVNATVTGLTNGVVAKCEITGITGSGLSLSNEKDLTPTATIDVTTCPASAPPTDGAGCGTVGDNPPPTPLPATPPSGTPPSPSTYGAQDVASLQESNDHSYPHYPLAADPSTGAIYQVNVTGSGTGTTRVLYPSGSFTNPVALLGGTFVTESHSVVTSVYYVADAGTGDIWRFDPGAYSVDGAGYTPPTKVLIASGLTGVSGLAGFACYTSSDTTPDGPVAGIPQECLYATDAAGVVRISLNSGAVTPLSSGLSGGATAIALSGDQLAITYSDTSVRLAAPSDGHSEGFQGVPSSALAGLATSDIAPSGQTWDAAVGDGVSNTSSLTANSAILYADPGNNIIGAIHAGSDVVIAGSGGTGVTTSSWTNCASAYLNHPEALTFHGPEGMLFVGEAGNGNFDMLETTQYTDPTTGTSPSACRIKALFSAPVYAGHTWIQAGSFPSSTDLFGVSCAPSSDTSTDTCVADGFTNGGVALYSHDGGVTWTQVTDAAISSINTYLTNVSCPTDNYCVIIGKEVGPSPLGWSNGQPVDWYTTNAAATTPTWIQGSVPFPGEMTDEPYFTDPTGISCLPSGASFHCVMVGGQGGSDIFTAAPVGSMYSNDGGATWTPSTTPVTGNDYHASPQNVSCASVSVCVATESGYGGNPHMWYTSDGGVNWTTGSNTAGEFHNEAITGVSCALGTTTCVAGGNIDTFTSTNGGASWVTNSQPPGNGYYYYNSSVSCPLANYCVAAANNTSGSGGVVATYSTGGTTSTWDNSNLNGSNGIGGGLNAVSCSSTSNCVAVAGYTNVGGGTDILISS